MIPMRFMMPADCLLLGMAPDICFSSGNRCHDTVVLIHGLGRTSRSFSRMENHLRQRGYGVLNLDYPSRRYDIRTLTTRFIRSDLMDHGVDQVKKVHFVTHSMGGIILRDYLNRYPMNNIGRVVMLSPPNQGSEVVDFLKGRTIARRVMGPAFGQLGTGPEGFVHTLGRVDAEVGIIAGNRSINWINSTRIPGDDDGKVSVARTRLENMKDFMVVKRTHTFIMKADEVLEAVVHFIVKGRFREPD